MKNPIPAIAAILLLQSTQLSLFAQAQTAVHPAISLRASQKSSLVEISWQTQKEKNTALFMVERSSDNVHFDTIGTIPASGFSDQPIQYSFSDSDPITGSVFYRLREIDLDGQTLFSNTIPLAASVGSRLQLESIKKDKITGSFYSETAGDLSIKLMSPTGQTTYQAAFIIQAGINPLSLPLQNLSKGHYTLIASNGNYRQSLSFEQP
jgi:hypothetical protein